MRVTFSHHLDGATWTGADAASGELRTGPGGLLGLLELRLGLGAPESRAAERVGAWMRRMETIDHAGVWFHDSFKSDQWSTAAAVLRLRDELVEAGWRAGLCAQVSSRLAALNALESVVDPPLPPGRADRLQGVHAELAALGGEISATECARTVLDIERITIIDREDTIEPVWRALFERLARAGVVVEFEPLGGGPAPAAGVAYELLTAADEWEAAESVATWLDAGRKENAAVTILCEGDSTILDSALRMRGLPVIGHAAASPWHEALQMLPLVFANAWKPVDVNRLAELLSFDYCPLPRWAARRFLTALAAEPGIGGRAWNKALEKIAERGRAFRQGRGESDADESAERETREMQRLLVERRFDPREGMPPDAVRELCALVVKRLSPKIDSDPAAAVAVGHARLLARLCEKHELIPRITLERMIDTIIADGVAPADIHEQAAPWRVASHPGAIIDPARTVIWWNFSDPGTPRATHWSEAERDALAARGIELARPETPHLRESNAWQRPAAAVAAVEQGAAATEAERENGRLIMVFPRAMHGEELRPHPWLDELTVGIGQEDLERTSAGDIFRRPEFAFAGRHVSLVPVSPTSDPPSDGRYPIGKNTIPRPEKISYSSMADLLACPMKWALARHVGLDRPGAAGIPNGNQMLGTLSHRIVELLYSDGDKRIESEQAARKAGELFDSLLESMAAELPLAGREVERRRAREITVSAVRRLVALLEQLGLVVESTEEWRNAEVDGLDLRGPIDLLARDANGRAFIIDMKWSSSSHYRREEIERGEALQLAVYSRILRYTEPVPPRGAGYFMLAQGELLTASPLLAGEALESELDDAEIFDRALLSWNERLEEINGGLLEATAVTQADDDRDELRARYRDRGGFYQQPPCRFCDFGRLCGLERDTV